MQKYVIGLMAFILVACSTVEKASLDASSSSDAISQVETVKQQARDEHADLLAQDLFEEGEEYLKEAREMQSEEDEFKEILESASYAKAYFQKAKIKAQENSLKATKVLTFREKPISLASSMDKKLKMELKRIDRNVIDETDNFEDPLTPEELSYFQERYVNLHINTIQHMYLADTEAMINNAIDEDAEDLAPDTLKSAKSEYAIALNSIKLYPNSPRLFQSDVVRAEMKAKLLKDVMAKFAAKGEDQISEDVALKLVYQDREIKDLDSRVSSLKSDIDERDNEIDQMQRNIQDKERKLSKAQRQVRFQEDIERIRERFGDDKAEVYRQGDKIIVRLKEMNFGFDSHQIPENSKPMLDELTTAIQDLGPKRVVIQGHTDSIGTDEYNEQLSKKRAKAVSEFLSKEDKLSYNVEIEGKGESNPLANNETPKGRLKNRRIDLVIETDQNETRWSE